MAHTHFVDGMVSGKHFSETTAMLRKNNRRLTDDEYGSIVLPNVVVACVDVALGFGGKLLLGLRLNEPYKGGWAFPGGRIKPGESFGDTASRHVRANLSLKIKPRRFRVVRTDSWVFSRRAQPPQDHGCHMTGTTVFARIHRREKKRIILSGDLGELRWMTFGQISKEFIHQAHRAAARNIRGRQFQPD